MYFILFNFWKYFLNFYLIFEIRKKRKILHITLVTKKSKLMLTNEHDYLSVICLMKRLFSEKPRANASAFEGRHHVSLAEMSHVEHRVSGGAQEPVSQSSCCTHNTTWHSSRIGATEGGPGRAWRDRSGESRRKERWEFVGPREQRTKDNDDASGGRKSDKTREAPGIQFSCSPLTLPRSQHSRN